MPKSSGFIYFAGALAVAQIGLLTVGSSRAADAVQMAQTTPPPKTGNMSQPVGTPEKSKPYQPANPAPDTRSAPTTSSTGVGSDNGGQPQDQKK